MITWLRRSIAIALALAVTLLTLGRIRVSWTGAGAASEARDPGRAAVLRELEGGASVGGPAPAGAAPALGLASAARDATPAS